MEYQSQPIILEKLDPSQDELLRQCFRTSNPLNTYHLITPMLNRCFRQTPRLLYHYCSMSAALSIIKGRALRLTNFRQMNDSRECMYLGDLIRKKLGERGYIENDFLKEFWMLFGISKIYFTSFSEHNDSLALWRGYSDDASGVCIGFHSDRLGENVNLPYCIATSDSTKLHHVMYDYSNYSHIIDAFVDCAASSTPNTEPFMWAHALSRLSPAIKHEGFSCEAEWRITLLTAIEEEHGKIAYIGAPSTAKYMCKPDRLLQFFEIGFDHSAIASLRFGPRNRTWLEDIQSYLRDCGYNGIDIVYSNVPYIASA